MILHQWKEFSQKTERVTCTWTACTVCGIVQLRDGSLNDKPCEATPIIPSPCVGLKKEEKK